MKIDDVAIEIGDCQYFSGSGKKIIKKSEDDDDDEDEDEDDEENSAGMSKTIEGICGMLPLARKQDVLKDKDFLASQVAIFP